MDLTHPIFKSNVYNTQGSNPAAGISLNSGGQFGAPSTVPGISNPLGGGTPYLAPQGSSGIPGLTFNTPGSTPGLSSSSGIPGLTFDQSGSGLPDAYKIMLGQQSPQGSGFGASGGGSASGAPVGSGGPGDFASAFAGLSAEEQANFTSHNPNVDLKTGLPKSVNIPPVGFNVDNSNTISGSHLAPQTMSDAASAYDQWFAGVQNRNMSATGNPQTGSNYNPTSNGPDSSSSSNGSNSASPTPTDAYMQQLYASHQFSGPQLDALNQYTSVTNQINQQTLAERRQIDALHSNGQLTTDQANQFANESQYRANQQLADLGVQQSAAATSLGVFGQIQQNNIAGLNALSPFYAPQQLSPGSSLVNAQGQSFAQGQGASPQTIFQTAQQLEQSAQAQGTLQYNSDGSVNHQMYIQQAQEYYNTHGMINGGAFNGGGGGSSGGFGGVSGGSGAGGFGGSGISLPQNTDGTYRVANGGAVSAEYAQKISQLPQQYQNYVLAGPQGVGYIDSSRLSQLPTNVQYQIQSKAAAVGIPWLDQTQSQGLQSVQSLYDTLDATQMLVSTALNPGVSGGITDYARTKLNDIFQTEPLLQGFKSLRTQAGAADTSLMGGIGSGFRQNTANLQLSIQNFPTSADSIENATAKIQDIRFLLDTSMKKTFPGLNTTSSLINTGSQGGSGGNTGGQTVQTRVGQVNTNW